MGYQFNPFTGNFDNVGSGGGGNPFDQSLNTTDSPTFYDLVATDIAAAPTIYWGYGTGTNSQGNSDGSITLYDRPNFTGFPATPPSNTMVAVANDLWFYRSGSNKYKVMLSGYSTSADLANGSNVCLRISDNSFTVGQTISAAANTSVLTASYSVTGANTTPLFDLSGTWNTTGVARGIKLNITDTASNTASMLVDLQVGGTSKFGIRKDGVFTSNIAASGAGIFSGSFVRVVSGGGFTFSSSSTAPDGAQDVILARDAAGALAQRNGTNAQTFRIYNTYTDASNYERGVFDWTTNANSLTIGTQKGGTGTARRLRINSAEQMDFYCTDTSRMFQISTSTVTCYNTFTYQYYSGAGDPTTATSPWNNGAGYCALWRNTTTGVVRLWANNNGTMVSIVLT
jgi:hypothetical protein